MNFFDINHIAFTLFGSKVSYLEFLGFVSGAIAVTLSAREKLLSWPIGIINVVLSFFLFYQSQLYPDMFLQVFFFVTNVIGWWRWAHPKVGEENLKSQLRVTLLGTGKRWMVASIGVVGTVCLGLFATRLHEWLPTVFSKPSAAPFQDSFITVVSVMAQYYLMHKKLESWLMWLLVDLLATYVYFSRDLLFYSGLYFVFCVLAVYALINWTKEYRGYGRG